MANEERASAMVQPAPGGPTTYCISVKRTCHGGKPCSRRYGPPSTTKRSGSARLAAEVTHTGVSTRFATPRGPSRTLDGLLHSAFGQYSESIAFYPFCELLSNAGEVGAAGAAGKERDGQERGGRGAAARRRRDERRCRRREGACANIFSSRSGPGNSQGGDTYRRTRLARTRRSRCRPRALGHREGRL